MQAFFWTGYHWHDLRLSVWHTAVFRGYCAPHRLRQQVYLLRGVSQIQQTPMVLTFDIFQLHT